MTGKGDGQHQTATEQCAPMDAKAPQGSTTCGNRDYYAWDGTQCVTLDCCEGSECEKFLSVAGCEARYQGCPCEPMEASPRGPCTVELGYAFDGERCVAISGCSCAGADCGDLFSSRASCEAGYSRCIACEQLGECARWDCVLANRRDGAGAVVSRCQTRPVPGDDWCTAMDAASDGECEMLAGYAFNGKRCVQINCSCTGTDCNALFVDKQSCDDLYLRCPSCKESDNSACTENEYCMYLFGRCDPTLGRCTKKPEGNSVDFGNPVCGCDKKTYRSRGAAATAGMSLRSQGPCICTVNDDCGEGHYCHRLGCDDAQEGECYPKSDCLEETLCGCNGQTYASECDASNDGVSIADFGPCGE